MTPESENSSSTRVSKASFVHSTKPWNDRGILLPRTSAKRNFRNYLRVNRSGSRRRNGWPNYERLKIKRRNYTNDARNSLKRESSMNSTKSQSKKYYEPADQILRWQKTIVCRVWVSMKRRSRPLNSVNNDVR